MDTAVQELKPPAAAPERARPLLSSVWAPPAAQSRKAGHGAVHAHHGEIVQGMFYSADGKLEHGLVTLPCSLFGTRARFRPMRSAPLTATPANRKKALDAARMTLDALGLTGWGGSLHVEGNVPLAWGCGSSTTDVLATIRAVADAFGETLKPEWLARIAVSSETASDSLMYDPNRAILFAQRRGTRMLDLGGPLPRVTVLGLNTAERGLETLALPPINYSWWELEAFQPMLGLLRRAVEHKDPYLLGRVATTSAEINHRHRPKPLMPQLLRIARATGACGVQTAHSGTVCGLLFDPENHLEGRLEHARACLRALGVKRTWEFSTHFPQESVR